MDVEASMEGGSQELEQSLKASTLSSSKRCKTLALRAFARKIQNHCSTMMGMKSLLVALLSLVALSSCRAEIVQLTDATFEHQTQVRRCLYNQRYWS